MGTGDSPDPKRPHGRADRLPSDVARLRLDVSVLKGLAQGIPYPAFVFDVSGRVIWSNQAARQRADLSGAALDGLSGMVRAQSEAGPELRKAMWLPSGERLRVVQVPGNERSPNVVVVICEPNRSDGQEYIGQAETGIDAGLSPREFEVARAVGRGESVAVLAARLGIKAGTVRIHLKKVYAKLGVANRAQLAVRMMALGARSGRRHDPKA